MSARCGMAVVLALLSSGAAASCLDIKDFTAQGGKLVETQRFVPKNVPDNFFCDRLACYGAVAFSGIVHSDGRVGGLTETSNTWTARPAEHAAVTRALVSEVRYRPPRLRGHAVCVRMRWTYAFVDKVSTQP